MHVHRICKLYLNKVMQWCVLCVVTRFSDIRLRHALFVVLWFRVYVGE